MSDWQLAMAEVGEGSAVVVLVADTSVVVLLGDPSEEASVVAVFMADPSDSVETARGLEWAAGEVESASADRLLEVKFQTLLARGPVSLPSGVHRIGSLSIPDERVRR